MKTLSEESRKKLKSTVIEARKIAEVAAQEVIESLGIREKDKPSHLDEEESELRRNLRAKARQLGDERQDNGYHETEHLEREIAYEHWHRMLFAQFLAENDLLIHPEMEVPVSIEECNQLAEEREEMDGFELAAQFASEMLPEIFKKYDPVLGVKFAPEYRTELKALIDNLPEEVFGADDSLGWVYQFWQEKKKDEINESEVDIGADELPAVTQLFTEHYMVKFLLDNTLGAWWKSRHPNENLPIDFEYLRTTENGNPAVGEFEGWPDKAAEIEVLDPAMGSGHFLITALPMLTHMRMKEENLAPEKAVNAVLEDNLYGLEIDERCTQIAAFALAFSAWKFPDTGGYRELPDLNLACSGIAPEGDKKDWLKLADGNKRLKFSLEKLYKQFQEAPILGSLISLNNKDKDLLEVNFKELQPHLQKALAEEEQDFEIKGKTVCAKGIAKAAELLSKTVDLVATNVPYLHKSRHQTRLKNYIEKKFPESSENLASAFYQRTLNFVPNGTSAAVIPQNALLLSRYDSFRKTILQKYEPNYFSWLGPNSFQTIGGEVVNVSLVSFSGFPTHSEIFGLDVQDCDGIDGKKDMLKTMELKKFKKDTFLQNVDCRINSNANPSAKLLAKCAKSLGGITTGDSPRYRKYFWELSTIPAHWRLQQGPPQQTKEYTGRKHILLWKQNEGSLKESADEKGATLAGEEAWGKEGVAVRYTGDLPATIYTGEIYENIIAVVLLKQKYNNRENKLAIWEFCKSEEFATRVRRIDKKWGVTCNTLAKIPFNLNKWKKRAKEEYPNGLPAPHSNDPTQWIFEGSIRNSERPLQVAVARLLGYSWPEQPGDDSLKKYEDEDGIVCLPAIKGERKAVDRLRAILAKAYGKEWSSDKETELLEKVDYGKYDLERWLWFKFAKQHYKLFDNRPFIWHITDGKKGGFSALVNYHKLDKKNLENLTYSYLGDWITKQERRYQKDKEGAEGLLQAAEELKEKLEAIIEGEPPYNIFVRWKTIAEQPIHWNPDLDDGVRMNIRPFYRAGILRHSSSLSINWNKDRGKDPESSYWYQRFKKSGLSEDKYDGERFNRYEDFPFTEGKLTNKKIRKARRDSEERDYEEYLE